MTDHHAPGSPWPFDVEGRCVLVVEDEYLLAQEFQDSIESWGGAVLGPVPSVADALALLRDGPAPDLAVLDINLQGDLVYPVAEALRARAIPFLFATGYDARDIPGAYADVPRIDKSAVLTRMRRTFG